MVYLEFSNNNMKKIFCILILIFSCQIIFGCDCSWNGGLLKNALKNKLTIHGKVKKLLTLKEIHDESVATSIQVEILKIVNGKVDKKIITVWGDRGADCRPYLSNLEIGSEWIFSLHGIENKEYAISICGENITPVENNRTWGLIFYNDRCSIKKPLMVSIDSLILAVNNPSDFIKPTKSCWIKDKNKDVYLEVNQMPKFSEEKSIKDFIKENLKIDKKDFTNDRNLSFSFDIIIDGKGNIEEVSYIRFPYERKRKKYKKRIIRIIEKSGVWISGKHNNENLKVRMRLSIHREDLI